MNCKYEKGKVYEVPFEFAPRMIAKCTDVLPMTSPEEGWLCSFIEQDTFYEFDFFVSAGRGNEWIKRQFDESGIPVAYAGQNINAFKWDLYEDQARASALKKVIDTYLDAMQDMFFEGKGLYLFSNTRGSGKTKLACCIAYHAVYHQYSVRFLSAADFAEQIREKENDFQKWLDTDLLIYDDLGAGGEDKDWPSRELFRLTDTRARNDKPTIWTSNLPIDKVKTDTRTLDRIYASSYRIALPEESIRRKLADEHNAEIMRRAAHG